MLTPIAVFLAIEFLDELVFGIREAAWPAIRSGLGLNYAAIGALLAIPNLVSGVLEPLFGLLADSKNRRRIVTAGGAAFALGLLLLAHAGTFAGLMIAFIILYPASGAFVSVSQATLMDLDPGSQEKNMARWTLAGSVAIVLGPLALVLSTLVGWGWRPLFFALGLATIPLIYRSRETSETSVEATRGFWTSARTAKHALRNREVLRWLVLLHMTDMLGDVLFGFLAVYFVDVVHVSSTAAAFAIIVWSIAGLVGDALLVPLIEHVTGIAYLRASAAFALIVYPGLLLVSGLTAKLLLLGALGLLRAGWYAIPQARLYGELPGNSGVALAVSNVAGLPSYTFPFLLGVLAQLFGLGAALWCCALAPVALLLGLPHGGRN